jgi:prophage regulatory protein
MAVKRTRKRKSKDLSRQALRPEIFAPKELLLRSEVTTRARLSNTTLWRLEKAGRFPNRVKIGFKRVAWRATEIDAWIAGRWVSPQVEAA